MKPDLYLGKNPYYFKYSRVRYTCFKQCANLDDCWEVYSPSERDFELMEKGVLHIDREDYPIYKNINMNLVHDILNSLRTRKCFKPCLKNPCGEQCVHCKCLNCWVCSIRDYWEAKC